MRLLTAMCTAALVLTAGPAIADADSPESLAQRADAAAAAASARSQLAVKVPTSQANATAAFLIPLRINNPRIGGTFGFNVVDPVTGDTVYSKMADTPMLPASNMKIVTAINALKVLGPDTRMTTDAVVEQPGVVILRGGGDTTLSTTGLTKLARSTADYLRSKSSGRVKVYVDDSKFPAPSSGPGWTASYQPYIVRPVRALGRLGVYQSDSAAEAGAVFASALRAAGVKARYSGHKDATAGAKAAASYQGDTVAAQVKAMLLVSENNIAEMLYRNVAVKRGRPATWKGARLAARDTIREFGLKTDGLRLMDGSGVSRNDRLTAAFLTDLLQVGLNTKKYPQLKGFFDSLPIGGRTGTLAPSAARFTTSPSKCAAGQVWAKTGTLFDTIGLSGYTRGADGEIKVFSALVNNRPQGYSPLSTRQAVDGLVATVNGCWGPNKKTGPGPTAGSQDGQTSSAAAVPAPAQGTVYGD